MRNAKPMLAKFGTALGTVLSGVDMWLNTMLPGVGLGYTLKHGKPDYATLERASAARPIAYPKPDGVLTFDRLTNVSFSGTNHEEDQPVHLKVADLALQKRSEHDVYAGPSNRYCPAGVYEWLEEARRAALRHQRAELRPLQDLRYQGPEPEHQLGRARGRRRTELSGNVEPHSATCRTRRRGSSMARAEAASRRAEGVRPDRRLGAAADRDAVAAGGAHGLSWRRAPILQPDPEPVAEVLALEADGAGRADPARLYRGQGVDEGQAAAGARSTSTAAAG